MMNYTDKAGGEALVGYWENVNKVTNRGSSGSRKQEIVE
jgi:hypothetical protein